MFAGSKKTRCLGNMLRISSVQYGCPKTYLIMCPIWKHETLRILWDVFYTFWTFKRCFYKMYWQRLWNIFCTLWISNGRFKDLLLHTVRMVFVYCKIFSKLNFYINVIINIIFQLLHIMLTGILLSDLSSTRFSLLLTFC